MKTQKILTLLLFACIALNGFSQGPAKSKESAADTSAVNALNQQCRSYIGSNNDSAILIAQQAKEMADKINYTNGIALAHKNIGLAYYYKGEYKDAIQNFQESIKAYEQLNDQTGVANILNKDRKSVV